MQLLSQCAGSGPSGSATHDFQIASAPGSPTVFSNSIANLQIYNTALAPQQVQQLYQEGVFGLPISGSSLAAWYQLNGNANDYSGNGNNGIPINIVYGLLQNYTRDSIMTVPVPTSLAPLPGVLSCTSNSQCASNTAPKLYLGYMPLAMQSGLMQTGYFNGQNSNVQVGSSLAKGSSVTLSLWSEVFGNGNVPPRGIMLSLAGTYLDTCYTGKPLFSVTTSSQVSVQGGACPSTGVWTHYVGTYNGVAGTLYINGAQAGSLLQSGTLQSGAAYVGQYYTGSYNFNGLLSDIQVYNSALSANQVQQLYQEGVFGLPIASGNVIGWWPLNGNANDYSGNGYGGTAAAVAYPYLSGTYNAPGMSSISATANEWQALGLANT